MMPDRPSTPNPSSTPNAPSPERTDDLMTFTATDLCLVCGQDHTIAACHGPLAPHVISNNHAVLVLDIPPLTDIAPVLAALQPFGGVKIAEIHLAVDESAQAVLAAMPHTAVKERDRPALGGGSDS